MTPVDGMAAANTMLGFGTWRQGYCLEAVWNAYSRNGAQDVNGKSDPTAYAAWQNTAQSDRVTGTAYDDIPGGVPVYFGPKSSSSAGDVVISTGGGNCVATDIPGKPGVIGRMKIADRQRQIGRPYLGWTRTILGWPISYQGGDDDMALDANADYPAFLNMLQRAFTYDLRPQGTGVVGTNDWTNGPNFFEQFSNVFKRFDGVDSAIAQINVSAPDVDYDALAAALVAQGITVAVIQPQAAEERERG